MKRARTFLFIATLAAASGAYAAEAAQPPATVASVDLKRYVGTWYEIARFPNRFQDQCVGEVTATYGLREDGRIDVVNRCRTRDGKMDEAVGLARPAGDDKTGAKLEVRFAPAFLSFLPFVWGDYWILGLGPDYEWSLVGAPGRDYLWLLARTPRVSEAVRAQAEGIAKANGFDVGRLVTTAQGQAAAGPAR
jgi:apolipoprotein D and lipocalin family protein